MNRDESKGFPDCSPEQIVALERIWGTLKAPDLVRVRRPHARKGSVQKRTMRALVDLRYLSDLSPNADHAIVTGKLIVFAAARRWPVPGVTA